MIETEYSYSRLLHSLSDRTKVWKSLRESTVRSLFRFYCTSTTGSWYIGDVMTQAQPPSYAARSESASTSP